MIDIFKSFTGNDIEALSEDGLQFIYSGQIFNDAHSEMLIEIFKAQIDRKELNIKNSEEWCFSGVIHNHEVYDYG